MSLNRMVDQLKLSDTVGSEDVVIEEEERQEKGVEVRKLSDEEMKKLSDDKYCVSEFKRNRLEIEAKKNWDLFYRRNKANFFKDRYWTFREFDELNEDAESQVNTILEIGCGVGNFIYPLIKHNKRVFAYACDFAPNAIDLLKQNADYDTSRINAFVCDVTQPNSLADSLPSGVQVDLVTLIFVLSAIHPDKMKQAVENIAKIVKPGGMVLVRDYGIYDHSMIRFQPGHKIDDQFYFRQDGTRTYFFSLDNINELFCSSSENSPPLFVKSISEYVFRETVNVKENLRVPRVFIQSKFVRC